LLPLSVLLLVAYHVWRIRKDGGLACVDQLNQEQKMQAVPPVASKTYSLLGITGGTGVEIQNSMIDDERFKVPSSPNLTMRLVVVTLATVAIAILFTLIVQAPLEEAANPAVTPNPAKAPWYFLWLQELVTLTTFRLGSMTINGALIGGIILPGVLVLAAALFPYFEKSPKSTIGVWFARGRKWQNTIFLVIVAVILILTFVGTFMRGPFWQLYWPWESWGEIPRRF
jgi:quinol-cytochrome oxidoreductase complex cytochrome b subunit